MSRVVFLLFRRHCRQISQISPKEFHCHPLCCSLAFVPGHDWSSSIWNTISLSQSCCLLVTSRRRLLGPIFTLTAIYTGIDVRLAVFNAHLVFNCQLSKNQQKAHGLKVIKFALSHWKWISESRGLPSILAISKQPPSYTDIPTWHDTSWPWLWISYWSIYSSTRRCWRTRTSFSPIQRAARLIALISHDPSRASGLRLSGLIWPLSGPCQSTMEHIFVWIFLVPCDLSSLLRRHSLHFPSLLSF